MVVERATFHLFHNNHYVIFALEYFFHLNDIGVGNHFDDLKLVLDERNHVGIEFAFVNMLHCDDFLGVFILALKHR